ncbi:hypothetical protein ACTQ42_06075 [Streptococcus alactolyticus]|uniref:hypothetical protein n=2 Tax=Streptococcus alactolyticus TaxID=29389 RepID=UPI003F9484D8
MVKTEKVIDIQMAVDTIMEPMEVTVISILMEVHIIVVLMELMRINIQMVAGIIAALMEVMATNIPMAADTLIVPMATGVHITLMMTMMMITVSGNSTFNNATPVGKASSNPGIITQSLKLKIMAEMMRQNNNIWDQKLAHIHQDEMFNILVSQKE